MGAVLFVLSRLSVMAAFAVTGNRNELARLVRHARMAGRWTWIAPRRIERDVGANDGVTMRRAGRHAAVVAVLVSIYADEGGYVDHKADRGGKTRYGITERVARAWGYQGHMRDFPQHCDADTPVCADRIYTTDYIDKPGFQPLAELSPAVLHEAVNSSAAWSGRSSIWFYRALNSRCGSNLKPRATVKWDDFRLQGVSA